nr:MAG TPA: hypothetical protein [Caudoviricetes sp.]
MNKAMEKNLGDGLYVTPLRISADGQITTLQWKG